MRQKFTRASIELLKEYLGAKPNPTEIEQRLLKKTDTYIKKIKNLSGVHMIGIGNSISMNAAKESSDIDLFIITSPHRLWFVRLYITLFFQIRGLRKNHKNHAGKFCLSFFCTTDGMNFGDFALEDDIYLYYWILAMKPLVNNSRCYQRFLEANAGWTDYMQFRNTFEKHKRSIIYTSEVTGEDSKILDVLNNISKNIFLPKTLKSFQKLGYPFGVIISDKILKFHDQDRRKQIKKDLGF